MGYRDDVDTLYTRAMILQRELDAAKQTLAERDAELARVKGQPRTRAETSPGMRELRELPDLHDAVARLVAIPEHDDKLPRLPGLPPLRPLPMPNWASIAERAEAAEPPATSPPSEKHRKRAENEREIPAWSLYERVRENVVKLQYEDLVLIAKIMDELTDVHDNMDEKLRARLRWLASEIALTETP